MFSVARCDRRDNWIGEFVGARMGLFASLCASIRTPIVPVNLMVRAG